MVGNAFIQENLIGNFGRQKMSTFMSGAQRVPPEKRVNLSK